MTTMINYGLMVALFMAWVGLFAVKDATREAAKQVQELEEQIEQEQTAIRTLMTDWAILNEPSYLQGLAQTHLALGTMAPQQIVTMAALPPVPLHDRRSTNGGTFFASAPMGSTYSTDREGAFMHTRAAPPRQLISATRPSLRPEFGS